MKTTKEIADTINKLNDLLRQQYSCDFAYTIMAKGETIAASNFKAGHIKPEVD